MKTSWNPFRELDLLRREVDQVFRNFGFGGARDPLRAAFLPGRMARAYPLLNVAEDGETLVVEAIAPGLDPDSIDVSLKDRTLTLSGEKKPIGDVPREAYHRSERSTGRFVRTLHLETDVDADHVEASYQDGIFTIRLPRSPKARPRQIDVKVN